jgi:Plasmid pRiA4b ORF-3-like protein
MSLPTDRFEDRFRLTPAEEQLLRAQTIDGNHPGPILRDFQAFLDLLAGGELKAATKSGLLSATAIETIDSHLSRPLRVSPKRKALETYPYVQALVLPARAAGFIQTEGRRGRVLLDPAVRESWDGLNATERYFSLLEAAFLFGRPEMVSGRSLGWGRGTLDCLMLGVAYLPPGGSTANPKYPDDVLPLGFHGSTYLVALADLFGLLEIEQPAVPVSPWCPAAIRHTAFGNAMLKLLQRLAFRGLGMADEKEDAEEEHKQSGGFGTWQPVFQPYFPEWKNNLIVPEPEAREGVFVFKVSLGEVWRRIAIPSTLTLAHLADAILDSVNFDDDHLYEFSWRDRHGAYATASTSGTDRDDLWANEVTVGDLPLRRRQSMRFLFDFGDNWEFKVKLEKIDPPNPSVEKAHVIEEHGTPPPQYPNWDEDF